MKKLLCIFALLLSFVSLKAQTEHNHTDPNVHVLTSLPELHNNCFNVVDIYVTHMSEHNEYTYDVAGAEVKPGANKNQLILSPTASQVVIEVSLGEKFIGRKVLPVSAKPAPSVIIHVDGQKMEVLQKGHRHMHELKLTAEYLEGVSKCVSGKFKVIEWNAVVLQRHTALVKKRTSQHETMKVSDWHKELKSGDRILIEVKRIVQLMPSGEENELQMHPQILILVLE